MFFAVVRGAYKWSAFYVIQSEFIAKVAILSKFILMNETNDGQMFFSRLEILSQSNDINTCIGKVAHSLYYFFFLFAQSKHYTAFRSHASQLQRFQHFHASPVFCLYPNLLCQAFYCFYIMTYNLWCCFNYTLNVFFLSFKIGNQCFESCLGVQGFNRLDRIVPDNRTSIF